VKYAGKAPLFWHGSFVNGPGVARWQKARENHQKWLISFAHQAAQKLLDLWILYELLNRRRILHQILDAVALLGRKPAEHAAHISALHLSAQIRWINPHFLTGHR
jgi:hypothetical protein